MAYIKIVIPNIKDISENLNSLSAYAENIIKTQDRIPRISIAHLADFNSLSIGFFSIIYFPQFFVIYISKF